MDVRAALDSVAEAGPFFRIVTDPDASWRPYAELLDEPGLRTRVELVRSYLAGRAECLIEELDLRPVASINFLGTVARLVSAPFATSVRHDFVPALTPETLFWKPGPLGAVEFATTADDTGSFQQLLESVVAPFAERVQDVFRLSPQVLLGNVASALAGAATVLADARGPDVVRALLASGWLAGTGEWKGGAAFRRTNCCLFYRMPGAGTCGDCVLVARR